MACFTPKNNAYCLPNVNAFLDTVLIHPRLHHIVKQVRSDNEGRIVNILLDIDDHILNTVNVYAPNKDCDRGVFFTDLNRFLSRFAREYHRW